MFHTTDGTYVRIWVEGCALAQRTERAIWKLRDMWGTK